MNGLRIAITICDAVMIFTLLVGVKVENKANAIGMMFSTFSLVMSIMLMWK